MSTARFEHDVIIVGAGPAGASTALHLAKRAPEILARTLILERDRHPRPKLCAGGLTSDVDRCLARMGLDVEEVPNLRVKDLHLWFEGRGPTVRLFDDFAFRVIRRHEFDGWLAGKARAAGASIQEDTRVKTVRRVDGGVEVETDRGTLRARAVVGADGSNGVVRRSVSPPTGAGVGRSVEVLTPPSSSSFPLPACTQDQAYIEFRSIPGGNDGYVLSFPAMEKGERLRSWAVWDSRITGGPPGGSLKDLDREEMARRGFRIEDHEVHGFPVRWYQPGAPLSAPHVILAGDAAGVDPFVGEGISQALGYGAVAADAIADAFARGDLSFAGYTRAIARSPLGRGLTRRHHFASALYRIRSRTVLAAIFHRGAAALKLAALRLVFNWAR